MITEFRGKYRWLSNFAPVEVELDGVIYPSVEHAYASAKSDDESWKLICSDSLNTPGYIKRKSKKVELIKNWDSIKIDIMQGLLTQKFNKEPYKTKLISTGDEYIQEGNYWNDTFWGVNIETGEGKNTLGTMIMQIRNSLKS